MSEMTIALRKDPTTGKQNITVSMESDGDALPHEHEQQHRSIVEKLLEKGIANPGDTIVIEREEEKPLPAGPSATPQQQERQAINQEG